MPLTQGQIDTVNQVVIDIQPHLNAWSAQMGRLNFLLDIHDLPDGQGGNVFSDAAATAILNKIRTDLKSTAQSIVTLIP